MDLEEALRNAPIFAGLSDADAASLVAAGRMTTFALGETIFAQDSPGRELHVLVDGAVEIVVDPAAVVKIEREAARPRVLARVAPGQSFGEMALVQGLGRSASARSAAEGTRVFSLEPGLFEELCRRTPTVGHMVFRHISANMARVVREQNAAMLDALLRDYFVHVLAEELAGELGYCDPTTPIEKTVTIRERASFLLRGLGGESGSPEKESFRLAVFAYQSDLNLFGEGDPSGFVVLEALFSLIREGTLPSWLAPGDFAVRLGPGGDRKSGVLACKKRWAERERAYFVRWEVKGLVADRAAPTVCLYVSAEDEGSDAAHLERICGGIDMPIQRHISRALGGRPGSGFRVLTVHHRTPEVAHTLRALAEHGFVLDAYVGIPYGEASWLTARLLDHASSHRYDCLTTREHAVRPTEHLFDFAQSSFRDAESEAELRALFEGERATCGYLEAMTRLCTLRLARALDACEAEGSRLLIYEDGAYVIPIVYRAHADSTHPLHERVTRALRDGTLAGVVEVTTAGERRNRAVIEENGGVALLPVLSCALEDIKLIYEGFGVAEAVIDAASTAFGNLGLPTFAARKPAILGGNGAIGTRLVEQLALAHNSAANVFVVDVTEAPFHRPLDRESFPHAATRLGYRTIRRFVVGPRCLALTLDRPLVGGGAAPDPTSLSPAVARFFEEATHDELVVTGTGAVALDWLLALAAPRGHSVVGVERPGDGDDLVVHFERGSERRRVTLLSGSVVLAFRTLAPLLRAGVDTVIGATGFEVFGEADLDAFLERVTERDEGRVDTLSLLSASSKDYEFKRVLVLFGRLLSLLHGAPSVDQALPWFADFYGAGRAFVAGPEAAEIGPILDAAHTPDSLAAALSERPELAVSRALAGRPRSSLREGLAAHLTERLRAVLTLQKEVRPDVGLLYHMTYRGRRKTLVLLANGLVVNFFARYEKGVKTEYIDPIVTMQKLGLVRLASEPVPPGLHRIEKYLQPGDMRRLWEALEMRCRPLDVTGG